MEPVYLDHNATTPLDPAAREAMLPWFDGRVGNPSSIHAFGAHARRAIDLARARVARLVGAQPDEIVFTSGGTESNNLAILGAAAARAPRRRCIATTAIEHQSVLNPCLHLRESGISVELLAVDHNGRLCPEHAISSMRKGTLLLSVMLANNDTGTIQPVGDLSARARKLGILLHTDAVQAVGKLPVDVKRLGVDLLSFSSHKLHGPQGVGALYVRKDTRLAPRTFGGHQERSLRPGTENLAGIVGFGKACSLAAERLAQDSDRVHALRASFEAALLERIPGISINAREASRLPNTSNVSFPGLDGEALAINLDILGLAVSTGAACSSADAEPSHVLLAMGRTEAEARSSVRFSFGRGNDADDVQRAVSLVVRAVAGMREDAR